MFTSAPNVKYEFERTVIQLLQSNSFYAHILMQVRRCFTKDKKKCPTAYVSFDNPPILMINEDYFMAQNKDVKKGILEHEVLHLVFRHNQHRFPAESYKSNHNLLNIAWDLVVNQLISPGSVGSDWQTIEKWGFPPNQTTEWYYHELLKMKDALSQKLEELLKSGALNECGCSHPGEGTPGSIEVEIAIKGLVSSSYEKAKQGNGIGNLPGAVREQVEKMIAKPKIHWSRELRQFNTSLGKAVIQSTTKRESKRFGTIPGTKFRGMANLLVAKDSSGSVSTEDLKIFDNEINHIYKLGMDVTVMDVDAEVHQVYPYRGKIKETEGRGGTDLRKIFDWIKEKKKRYDGVIILTDGGTPNYPAAPISSRVLWVITKNGSKCSDWGRTIFMD